VELSYIKYLLDRIDDNIVDSHGGTLSLYVLMILESKVLYG